ncbi:MAG TPA: hypothetical protein VMU51_21230 [Mycobacteriales bacterium]|nr:hypothetical protein [Mycobacteriales bacterium]
MPYQKLLLDQLADERATKTSLEQRGIAVISTAGTLVAITLGFVGLANRGDTNVLPATAMLLLMIALSLLVGASAGGLLINLPARSPIIDTSDLAGITAQHDQHITPPDSSREEYDTFARLLIELRKVTRTRTRALFLALILEVLALILMASSAILTLWPALRPGR